METSQQGIDIIKRFEGLGDGDRQLPGLQPYRDLKGVWTIGYGHTGDFSVINSEGETVRMSIDNPYTTISVEQAEDLLKRDIVRYENYVKKYVKKRITQEMFDALVSFTYNLGHANLRLLITARLNIGRYTATADAMLLYNKANGVVWSGLVRRRKEERLLFLSTFKLPGEDI